jgi:hypothetical protein
VKTPTSESLFAYPEAPHVRRHGPKGYTDYASFKPWLRDEFAFRCVYCLVRERWFPNGEAGFSVDHVEPQASAPDRLCDYTNLVYACLTCNSTRQDQRLPDPCAVGYAALLCVREGGDLEGLTLAGVEMIARLGLNHPRLREFRHRMLGLLQRIQRTTGGEQADLRRWFGYPDDLPDLASLRPPEGNHRPGGLAQSHFERRKRGELPETY